MHTESRQAVATPPRARRVPVPALLAALGTAALGLPAALEGQLLVQLSRQHGLTTTDLVAAALLVVGLLAASRAAGCRPAAWVSAPGRSFLFAAAAGLGLGGTYLGDEARWVWLLSAVLVHVGCGWPADESDPEAETPWARRADGTA